MFSTYPAHRPRGMRMTSPARRGARRRLLAGALAAGLALAAGGVHAQVGVASVQRSFINLGFELPDLQTTACRVYISEEFVPGWTTDHPDTAQQNVGGCVTPPLFSTAAAPIIELWKTPRQTVDARSGSQLAELNAVVESRISQNVCLEQNDEVRWRFSHRGRASDTRQDQMRFLVGTTPIVEVGTTNSGVGGVVGLPFQGTAASVAGPGGWRDYTGSFVYAGTSGVTNIGFEAVPVPGGSPTEGNFLDDIQVFLKPFIELDSGTYETMEGATSGLPMLRITGTLDAALTLDISVIGGSAVLNTDYTAPGGSTMFNVVVPAGTYDGTETILLGLAAPENGVIEGPRTVELRLEADPDQYFTRSTSVCGEAGFTLATWTILDNDLDLDVQKQVSPANAVAGDSVAYTLLVNHLQGADADGAVLRDPPVAGLDCAAATPSCSVAGGAACPNPLTIGALQGAGLVIPTLPAGGQVEIGFSCVVVDPP